MEKIHASSPNMTLTADQQSKLLAIVESAPSMLGLHYFSNLDASSNEEVPTGIAMYFPPDALVDATLISDSMFQVLAVSRVLSPPYGKTLDDAHFMGKLDEINAALEQHPKLAANGSTRHPDTNQDRRVWKSELGGIGSFAGVYFQLRDDHRTKDYYYVAQGTVPLVVRDLKQQINEKAPTFQQLLFGKEWKGAVEHAGYLAQRNAQKNLATLSEVCETGIKRVKDAGAALVNENGDPVHHMAPPERAVPTWQQTTYSIRDTMYQGKPAVAIYNGVVPKQELSALTREDSRYFVVANPVDGLYSFPISSRSVAGNVAGLPADTGRDSPRPSGAGGTTPSHLNVVTWERPTGLSQKNSLHEDILRANPLTKTIKTSIKAAGWNAEDHVGLLVPLALKLYNPDIRRK